MSQVAVRVEELSKLYHIGGPREKYRTFRDTLMSSLSAPARRVSGMLRGDYSIDRKETIWALKDVSFEIEYGEVIGIIGHNGAGKSTLLKILSRITEPTEGRATIYGRVGSLLEVGTGFHAELTGRENVYLNAAILGMKRKEIDKKFDEIVAFAEIEKFIETPVKHYSTGMGLRLGFAVAAFLEPEILIVDEVLAVGDVAFQKKCLGKMGEVAQQGRTVLLVSHNMAAINNLTSRTILLSKGQVTFDGDTSTAISHYLTLEQPDATERSLGIHTDQITFDRVRIVDKDDNPVSQIESGDDLSILLDYSDATISSIEIMMRFIASSGTRAFTVSNRFQTGEEISITKQGVVRCNLKQLNLTEDQYTIQFAARYGGRMFLKYDHIAMLDVSTIDTYGTSFKPVANHGIVAIQSMWSSLPQDEETVEGSITSS